MKHQETEELYESLLIRLYNKLPKKFVNKHNIKEVNELVNITVLGEYMTLSLETCDFSAIAEGTTENEHTNVEVVKKPNLKKLSGAELYREKLFNESEIDFCDEFCEFMSNSNRSTDLLMYSIFNTLEHLIIENRRRYSKLFTETILRLR